MEEKTKKPSKANRRSHFNAVYNLKYHLVLVTKYRRKCITKEILDRLHEILKEQCENWSVQLVEFNGEEDHVHLLIDAHPSMDLSKPFFWTRAYCLLTTGGAPLEVIKKYIQNQDSPN